jgi:hypothetical protein
MVNLSALPAPKGRAKAWPMRRVTERWRGRVALVLACLVHLGAQLAVRSSGRAADPSSPPAAQEPAPSEVDVEIESVPSEEPRPASDDRVASAEPVPSSLHRRAAPEGSSRIEPSGENPAGSENGTSAAPAPVGSTWTFNPTMPNILPGAVEMLAQNGGRVAAEAPVMASKSGGLIESLDAADVARGLGRGGPVRSAIDLAARADEAPVRGNATFSVTIFSDGKVDVQVASNHTDWAKIIPAIRDAVKKLDVRLPPNSRGLNVVVAVEAKVKYPDGYEPPEKTTVTVEPALDVTKPLVDVDIRGKRCSAHVAIAPGGLGAGGGCSVGNPMRVVATRIVSEGRL